MGDRMAMQKAIDMLSEVKESIMNAYEIKSGLERKQISKMMDAETWLNAKKAVELGFADSILFDESEEETEDKLPAAMIYTPLTVTNSLVQKLSPHCHTPVGEKKVKAADLEQRLNLLIH